MRETKDMLVQQVISLRDKLERSNLRVEGLTNELATSQQHTAIEANRVSSVRADLEYTRQQLRIEIDRRQAPFTRQVFESYPRIRLVSFIEEAINEARRKGMVEAEGLMNKHREFTRETDVEMMTGLVRSYQERIDTIAREKKEEAARAAAPIKLDTRPLTEKLQPAGQTILPTGTSVKNSSTFRAPGWWQVDKPTSVPITAPASSAFKEFDEFATNYEHQRKFTDGAKVIVKGFGGGSYILSRRGEVHSCSCPAWQFAKEDTARRTCKHLVRHLGQKFEAARTAKPLVQLSCYCGVILVRGQCQIHTRDWKGDEKCQCGRAFASCKAAYDTISVAQRKYGHQPRLA